MKAPNCPAVDCANCERPLRAKPHFPSTPAVKRLAANPLTCTFAADIGRQLLISLRANMFAFGKCKYPEVFPNVRPLVFTRLSSRLAFLLADPASPGRQPDSGW